MNTRTILTVVVLFVGYAEWARAQGSFISGNFFPVADIDAPVFDAFGVPLEGPNYLAALYGGMWSPDAQMDSLEPTVAIPFRTGEWAGYFGPQTVALDSVPPEARATVQIRAWDSRLGATYEEVAALGIGGYGESQLLDGFAGGGTHIAEPPYGLQSFSLRPVIPEPSPVWLALLGLPLLLWRKVRTRCKG